MNENVKIRTSKKLAENQEALQHVWTFNSIFGKRDYVVMPVVFSPSIFCGTEWLTEQVIQNIE